MRRCEHCRRRLFNPWSRLCTYGLWHLRCLDKLSEAGSMQREAARLYRKLAYEDARENGR